MLSMKAKYALRALIVLARKNSAMMQTKNIALEAEVPHKFLETILQELKAKNIVSSKRGVFGGYFLSKAANEIKVGDIVRYIDGPLAPIRCASVTAYEKCEDCTDEKTCSIRKVMLRVRNSIAEVLDNCYLSDMVTLENKNWEIFNYSI